MSAVLNPLDLPFFFFFDAETDGLWGPPFAIAVVVVDKGGMKVDQFEGRVKDLSVVKDQWVQEHIVPVCEDLTPYPDARSLREAFWQFWIKWKGRANAASDCGAVVEGNLIRLCVEDDLETRFWEAPFPLLDLGTLLYLRGINPCAYREGEESCRRTLVGLESPGWRQHNPLDDALASALCWVKYLKG